MTASNDDMQTVDAHCNQCGGERRHDLVHEERKDWREDVTEYNTIGGGDTYEMLRCCGCGAICLRHKSWFSEDADPDGEPLERTAYYPPATFRREPRWIQQLLLVIPVSDRSVHDLLKEIYVAIHNGSLRLGAMGIRSLLEHVMIEKVGDNRSFSKNLDQFEKQGFVSKLQRTVLGPVLEAGHATTHRSYQPSEVQIVAALDITENIIESIYINALRASEITVSVPPMGGSKPQDL